MIFFPSPALGYLPYKYTLCYLSQKLIIHPNHASSHSCHGILLELLLPFSFPLTVLYSFPFIFFFLFIYYPSSTLIFLLKNTHFLLQHAAPSLCHLFESPFIAPNPCHCVPYYWKTEQLHSTEMPMAVVKGSWERLFP